MPLSSPSIVDWLGGERTHAGVRVSEQRVLGIPAYYRGVSIVSGTMAGLPLKPYQRGTRTAVMQRTVLDNPNPRQTPFEFWQTMYANAVTWGNMYGRKLRDGADIVRQVWPLHPSRVRVEEVDPSSSNPEGKVFHVTARDGSVKTYSAWDIFHVPYLSIDGVAGISPLNVFRQSLGTGIAAEETAARLFGAGMRIQGVLQTEQKLNNDIADAIKARWRQKTAGVEHTGDVVVLDKGLKFEPIMLPPQEAELLTSRKWAVTDISRMVGLPPFMLGDMEKTTSWGTGIEQQVLGVVKFGFKQLADLVEQRATRELLPGGWTSGSWFAEYSLEGLLRGDSRARAEFYRTMVMIGALSLNEVRVLENEEPVDGLDVYLLPKNMTVFDPATDKAGAIAAALAA
ncbi:MAG TPA: phage portal protein [Acidimicrobiales bacterium]|nr:phage portal protein [Acidimicrobiales bacterium]